METLNSAISALPKRRFNFDFNKIEEKYFARIDKREELLRVVKTFLRPAYPHPKTRYNLIESIYFDSDDFQIFQRHFQFMDRFKLRIRRYAPNGVWQEGPVFLERKAKVQGVTKKFRIRIPPTQVEGLLSGQLLPFSWDLRLHNLQLTSKKLTSRLERINQEIRNLCLKPVCSVQFHRLCFENSLGLRLTLDSDLRCHNRHPGPVGPAQNLIWEQADLVLKTFKSTPFLILEVKHDEELPRWFRQVVDALDLKQINFSKYCFAIADSVCGKG